MIAACVASPPPRCVWVSVHYVAAGAEQPKYGPNRCVLATGFTLVSYAGSGCFTSLRRAKEGAVRIVMPRASATPQGCWITAWARSPRDSARDDRAGTCRSGGSRTNHLLQTPSL